LSESEKQKLLARVAKKAGDYEEVSISCSQGTLVALQEEFNLSGGEDVIRAGTFMPGVASRKETCGAVLGGLMALGLKFGKDRVHHSDTTPEEREETLRLRKKAWTFCEEFKKEMGSTMCGDIKFRIMGKEYDSMDPVDRQRFIEDGGPRKCRVPPETAARIAAAIILEG
jgi:C_GCAxxG_C_C family probable redox protein